MIFECGAILTPILEQYEPGFIEDLIAGEMGAVQMTPEVILVLAAILMAPPFMAFLSLALKDSISRWANIIGGYVFAVLALAGLSDYLIELHPWAMLIWVSQVVANAIIVWYAWKSGQKASVLPPRA